MAYPFEPLSSKNLKLFWEVIHGMTLYNRETNQNDTFDTSKQTDKLSRNEHTRQNKSPIFRPQRQRKN